MTIDPNDPRLTAYALGELDEKERGEVEALLDQSPAARRAVEEIRATAQLLTEELQAEPAVGLSAQQRAAIEAHAASANSPTDSTQSATPDPSRPLHRPTQGVGGVKDKGAVDESPEHHVFAEQVPGAEGTTRPHPRWRWYRIPATLAASLLLIAGTVYFLLPSLEAARKQAGSATLSDLKGIGTSGREYGDANGWGLPGHPGRYKSRQLHGQRGRGALRHDVDGKAVASRRKSRVRRPTIKKKELSPPPSAPAEDRLGGVARPQATGAEETGSRLYESISYGYEVPYDGHAPAGFNIESYDHVLDNPFLRVAQDPLSTFSIDVDTASYANIRRFLDQGQMPPKGAVRIEEMVNYFSYDYPLPTGDDPFSVNVDLVECPWAPDHLLARIGLKGWEMADEERPAANLVFLLDVSGSMGSPNKLPLLKQAMQMLVGELATYDRVAIAVYAGASGLVLPSTSCESKGAILQSLDRLQAGGSTNGGAGIQLAYDVAEDNFIEGGINRVILATDGDFNVGVTNRGSLTDLIQEKAQSGVFLSVLGFGMGNLKDSTLETLADKGNGNYAYIDTASEAQKVLVEQMGGTLITIAKDVKIQIEFNPAQVNAYRLIGYENRLLAAQDFNDDTKDAGEIGSGHTVTAFYEIVPTGVHIDLPYVDPLKYQTPAAMEPAAESGELMTVKLRYKEPDGYTSELIEVPVRDQGLTLADVSEDFAFATAVASFGMLLRDSPYKGNFTFDAVIELASASLGGDPNGYRAEFVELVREAARISGRTP